jgi:hypothetical protein
VNNKVSHDDLIPFPGIKHCFELRSVDLQRLYRWHFSLLQHLPRNGSASKGVF